MRCPKFRNYDVSPGTKHKRGVKSRVKKLSVTRDQNSIFFLEVDPIPFLGLDLIDPRSSFFITFIHSLRQWQYRGFPLDTCAVLCGRGAIQAEQGGGIESRGVPGKVTRV